MYLQAIRSGSLLDQSSQATWLFVQMQARFPLSLRNVDDLLFERGLYAQASWHAGSDRNRWAVVLPCGDEGARQRGRTGCQLPGRTRFALHGQRPIDLIPGRAPLSDR